MSRFGTGNNAETTSPGRHPVRGQDPTITHASGKAHNLKVVGSNPTPATTENAAKLF